jgi:hypothetical protein
MFAAVHVVVASSVQVHGAFDPWLVLLWLGLVMGCLLLVAGVTALVQLATTRLRRRVHRRPRARRRSEAS